MPKITLKTIISYLEDIYNFEISTENIEYNIYDAEANIECFVSENIDSNYDDPFQWEQKRFSIDFEDLSWKKWLEEKREFQTRQALFDKINNAPDKDKARQILKEMGVGTSSDFYNLKNEKLEKIINLIY